ncbi:MAG: CZB domain-containing protein [Thiobacillaceae bacterium]|nr:CZB domain-containing protein [Thiobacillaceae bacterium]
MEGAIAATALRSFVELAKVDHLIFKFEIYRVLFGHSQKAPEEFASHTTCRLGKWYYEGDGVECFSRLPGYRELESPHMEVHRMGVEALRAYRERRLHDAISALDRMEAASREVVRHLESIAASGETNTQMLCTHTH